MSVTYVLWSPCWWQLIFIHLLHVYQAFICPFLFSQPLSGHQHDLLTSVCASSPCMGPLWLSWLWSSSSWPSTSSSVMEICGGSTGWSCQGRCCPGISASSSSSSCHLMSARYQTTLHFFFPLVVTYLFFLLFFLTCIYIVFSNFVTVWVSFRPFTTSVFLTIQSSQLLWLKPIISQLTGK